MTSSKKISDVLKEVNKWMSIPGVEGIGEGKEKNKPCIIVFVSLAASELRDKIPSTYKGYPVLLQETGTIGIQ